MEATSAERIEQRKRERREGNKKTRQQKIEGDGVGTTGAPTGRHGFTKSAGTARSGIANGTPAHQNLPTLTKEMVAEVRGKGKKKVIENVHGVGSYQDDGKRYVRTYTSLNTVLLAQ